MTEPLTLRQVIRIVLAKVPPGKRIETLALATAVMAEIDDGHSIEDVRDVIRVEAIRAGVEWRDEK
jgi:hypothetical protein